MERKGMYISLLSSTNPHYPIWQINPAQQRALKWQVQLGLGAKTLGVQLFKGPLLWAIGQLSPWQEDTIFLRDHFMLLSMFNLYNKAFSSKWQTPTEPSERLVNQKPYEICGISMPLSFFPPGKESPAPFRFQSSLPALCLELPAGAQWYLNIVFIWPPRVSDWLQLRLAHL